MKVGIIAAIGLALVAMYLVFATDLVRPASSSEVTRSGETQSADGDEEQGVSGEGRRAEQAGEPGQSPSGKRTSGEPGEATPANADSKTPEDSAGGEYPVVKTFTRNDGTVVRDHRPDAPPPDLDAYTVLPASVSKVKSDTLVAVQIALRPKVSACIKSHSSGAEDRATLMLYLNTSISAEILRVDQARVKISGLADQEALDTCVVDAVQGHEQEVADAQDVNLHRMVFNYRM